MKILCHASRTLSASWISVTALTFVSLTDMRWRWISWSFSSQIYPLAVNQALHVLFSRGLRTAVLNSIGESQISSVQVAIVGLHTSGRSKRILSTSRSLEAYLRRYTNQVLHRARISFWGRWVIYTLLTNTIVNFWKDPDKQRVVCYQF